MWLVTILAATFTFSDTGSMHHWWYQHCQNLPPTPLVTITTITNTGNYFLLLVLMCFSCRHSPAFQQPNLIWFIVDLNFSVCIIHKYCLLTYRPTSTMIPGKRHAGFEPNNCKSQAHILNHQAKQKHHLVPLCNWPKLKMQLHKSKMYVKTPQSTYCKTGKKFLILYLIQFIFCFRSCPISDWPSHLGL